ncbi:hypothetical protein HYFRA_00003483 [Hymenoscyphus fraxineus]|uniref:2EXR domain-containing protein n=1 Tax=Hymenoscyphus fraxineus TaxID=746836 RepID=A0A9N9KTF5_9HELO|nr:hypothetical protein HYFRA_00003483 [Hymenoscyphus fraxineus]
MNTNTNTTFSLLATLPTDLRLMIWEAAYLDAPRRVIQVDFPAGCVDDMVIAVKIEPLTALMSANHESRSFLLRYRFISPFSSALEEEGCGADETDLMDSMDSNSMDTTSSMDSMDTTSWAGSEEASFSRSFPHLLFDPTRDILDFANGEHYTAFDFFREGSESGELPEFPLLLLFNHVFAAKKNVVLEKLVSLKICCNMYSFLGITDVASVSTATHDLTMLKNHLPRLEELIIKCECHCQGVEARDPVESCAWVRPEHLELPGSVVLTNDYCCDLHWL